MEIVPAGRCRRGRLMLTRRELLKRGLATPAFLAAARRLEAGFDGGNSGKGRTPGDAGRSQTPFVTAPFVERLPIPTVKAPIGAGPDCARALTPGIAGSPLFSSPNGFEFFDEFPPQLAYELHVTEGK